MEHVQEAVDQRAARPAFILLIVTLVLTVVALSAATVVTYLAYERQDEQLGQVVAENSRLKQEHEAIGAQFAAQTKKLEQAVALARRSARRRPAPAPRRPVLPARVRRLSPYVARGFLVPRRLPAELAAARAAIRTERTGYSVRWSGLALFASGSEPISVWTRQAWPGTERGQTIGGRRVRRFVGPAGIVYAWQARRRTYALLAVPARDGEARRLISSLR